MTRVGSIQERFLKEAAGEMTQERDVGGQKPERNVATPPSAQAQDLIRIKDRAREITRGFELEGYPDKRTKKA